MNTNAKFLKDDYMMSNNVRSKVVFLDLDKTPTTKHYTMDLVSTIPISSTPICRRGGRVIV